MTAPHDYYEYGDGDLDDERRTARWRGRAAAGLAAGIAVAAATLLFACNTGQPAAWPAAIPDPPANPPSATTPSTPTTTTPPVTTPPMPTPDPTVPDDIPDDLPDDGGDTDGEQPDAPGDDEPTEPDPCDELETGTALLMTPDPVVLEDGVMSSTLTITNCSDEHIDWTAATLSTVTLADDGGNLGPSSTSELAFDIDATAYEPGAIDFTIWISEPDVEHPIDVHAFHVEVLT